MGMKNSLVKNGALALLALILALGGLAACEGEKAAANSDKQRLAQVRQMYQGYKEDFPGVSDIEPQKAIELWKQGKALFVDIRDPEEQEVSMLPGAVTQAQFEQNPDLRKGKTVITYCTISYRSGKFAESLEAKGQKSLNLEGGLLGWVHAGGPVFQGDKQVKKIHVYGSRWDLAPPGHRDHLLRPAGRRRAQIARPIPA